MEIFETSKTGRKIRKDSFEFNNDMEFIVCKLKELYVDRQLSTNQIPIIFEQETKIKITSGKCYSILSDLGLLRNKSESISLATSTLDYSKTFLNDNTTAILDGIVMGDGTMNVNHKTKVARISISGAQEEFICYCKKLLGVYDACDPVFTPPSGIIKESLGVWTTRSKFHPDLYTVYNRWYNINGVKDVPPDVSLMPMSILLWYLGDGSLSSRTSGNSVTLYFSTNSFSREAIKNNLCSRMEDLGFLTSRITDDNRLFIKTGSIVPLLDYMGGESPVKCYSYKFDIDDWRKKKSMKDVAKELQIDYGKLASLVKTGFIKHSRSPGGKKVVFSQEEFDDLSKRLSNGEIPRGKGKQVKIRPLFNVDTSWDAQIPRLQGESDNDYLYRIAGIYIANGFPYKKYSCDKLEKEWFGMRKSQYVPPENNTIKYRKNGLSFADHFNQHIFSLKRKYKISPVELFNNKELLIDCLKRNNADRGLLTYAGLHSIVCADIKSPRLNNFPPLIARDIYNYYCKDGDAVIDPCAGFGGRLTGASVCKRNVSYTGIDPSEKTYFGLVELQKFIKKQSPSFASKIINGCAEDEMEYIRDGSFDFCFTSPPYFDTEEYDYKNTQSFIRYNEYQSWVDGFLYPLINHAYRILKENSYFLINIGKYGKYAISEDIKSISSKVGFKIEEEKYIEIPRYGFVKSEDMFRKEPLIVMKK